MNSIGKGVIALLEGKRPEETVRQLTLASRYSWIVGQYESRRGRVTATVEKHGQTLRLSLGEQQLVLSPERVGDETVFVTIGDNGYRQKARFVQRNGTVELLFERHRLFKQQ